MTLRSKSFWSAGVTAAAVTTSAAFADLLFYESFNFTPGTSPNGTLTEGSNPNGVINANLAPTTIAAGSLQNPMALPSTGNRFSGQTPSVFLNTNFTYDAAGNVLWGSFLAKNVGSNGFPSGLDMSVNSTTANNQNIGVYFYQFFAGVGVNGILGTPFVNYRTDGQAQLFVFRADQDSFDLWVNPLSTNLGAPAYTTAMSPITRINRLRFNVSGTNDLDEVRLGTTQFDVMLPSPSAAALLGLGGLLAARRRR